MQSLISMQTRVQGYVGEVSAGVVNMQRLERCMQDVLSELAELIETNRLREPEQAPEEDDDIEMDEDREMSPEV